MNPRVVEPLRYHFRYADLIGYSLLNESIYGSKSSCSISSIIYVTAPGQGEGEGSR